MIARIEPDRTGASVVSIPRDSWVEIPGRGFNKINAAYSFGGPSLLIQTVEDLTALRIDHFAVIDFAGFQSMVDSVGGIDVAIAEATRNQGVDFRQGVNHLDGAQALAYVQQRYGLPNGDPDRAHRQQNALRALLAKAASSGTLSDPIALYDLLDATSRSVGVDDTLSNGGLRSLALDLGVCDRVPSRSSMPRWPVSVARARSPWLYLDGSRSTDLWTALRAGRADGYADRYPADALGATTR